MKPWEQYQTEQAKKPWEMYGGVTQPQQSQEKGLFGRIAEDLSKRKQNLDEINRMHAADEQTLVEGALQGLGQVAGGVGDIVGQGIVSGFKTLTPQPIKDIAASAVDTKAGRLAGKVASGVGEAYGKFSQKLPRAARNIEAVTNIGMLAAPTIGKSEKIAAQAGKVGKALNAPKVATLSSEEIRTIGGNLFKQAESMGGQLKPQLTDTFINDLKQLTPKTAQDVIISRAKPGGSVFENVAGELEKLRGMPLSLENAKNLDEMLGEAAYSTMDNFGKLSSDGKKLLDMQNKLRNRIEFASPDDVINKEAFDTVKEARAYWGAHVRLREIERIIERAQMTETPSTSLKTQFRNLAARGDKLKGYTTAEAKAIQKAANTGVMTDVFRVFGSRLAPLGAAAAGGATGGTLGAMAAGALSYIGATGSRNAATALQMRKARFVEDLIRKRIAQSGAQSAKITPEIAKLMKELGVTTLPAGGASAALEQLKQIRGE